MKNPTEQSRHEAHEMLTRGMGLTSKNHSPTDDSDGGREIHDLSLRRVIRRIRREKKGGSVLVRRESFIWFSIM